MNEELMNMLANIQALLNEVSQTLGGAQQEPTVEAAEPDTGINPNDKKPEFMANKAVVETTNDDVDANDPAETRLNDDNTDVSQKNTEEMAKSILDALSKQMVKKDSKIEKSDYNNVLKEISTAIKVMASNQVEMNSQIKEQEQAIINVFKALKIEDEVLKVVKPAEKPVQKGLNGNNDLMEQLVKAIKGEKEDITDTPQKRDEYLRKSLRDPQVLKYFTGQLGV